MADTARQSASDVGKKAGKNAMAGMAATAVYFLSRIALTPIILTYISLADFGLWSICFVILSYAAVGAVGINNAYIKFTAHLHAEGDIRGISTIVSTGMVFMVGFALLFYGVLYLLHPWILTLFNVAPESMDTAAFMVMGTTIVFCIDFTLGGFRSILDGLQEIAFTKTVNVAASVFEVVLILVFLHLGMGIKGLLYAYGIKTVAEMAVCTGVVFNKLPGFTLNPALINKKAFRELFVYVGKVQVLGAVSIFNASLARFVVAAFMGLTGTGLFEIGRKFPFTGRNISRSAFAPFFPAASYIGGRWQRGDITPVPLRVKKYTLIFLVSLLIGAAPALVSLALVPGQHPIAQPFLLWGGALVCLAGVVVPARWLNRCFRDEDRLVETELQGFYLQGLRLLALLNATVFGFLMAVAAPLITCWVGAEYLAATGVMVLISLANMIHLCTGPATQVFRGINRSGREFEYLIIQVITALMWIPAGTHAMGINGAALGVLFSSVLASLFLFLRSNQAFGISSHRFIRQVALPAVAPLASAAAVYALTLILPGQSRVISGIMVIVLGVFHLGLTFLLLWKGFLSPEESRTVMKVIRRFIPVKA